MTFFLVNISFRPLKWRSIFVIDFNEVINRFSDLFSRGEICTFRVTNDSNGNYIPDKVDFQIHNGEQTFDAAECWWSPTNATTYDNIHLGYVENTYTHLHVWVGANAHSSNNRYGKVYKTSVLGITYQDRVDYDPGLYNLYFEYDQLIKLGEVTQQTIVQCPDSGYWLEYHVYPIIIIPRLLAFFLMCVLILMNTTRAISQESLATDFIDFETQIRFFTNVESSQQLWSHESLTVLSPLDNSVWSFRQQLKGMKAEKKQVSIVEPIWGGLFGAIVGFFGGGFIGAATSGHNGFDAIGNFVVGSIFGETLVMPLGVHYGNKRKGNFGLDLLTSLVIAGGGLLIKKELDADELFLLFIPVLQIGTTVAVERITAHHK